MTLSVVGAGLGRTGTMSLKHALEQLGLGRCFHMIELVQNPHLIPYWEQAGDGQPVNWDVAFAGFGATVDWPSATYYRQLAAEYPEAKIILTLRDADKWFDSTQNTIFKRIDQLAADPANNLSRVLQTAILRMFDGDLHDRMHCIGVYERHNAEVQRVIPKERLLVFNVAEGWEPLCTFLGLPVPAAPFPAVNSTEDFQKRFAGVPAPSQP
jgi:hypothetical protein